MDPARWKLISLWFSQTARVAADNALRFFVCLDYASHGPAQKNSAWYLVTAIFTIPAVLFAPFNGALCNSLPKPRVLTWSAFYGVAVMAVFGLLENYWIACLALISTGSAIYGPTRYAMLPAASADTKWTLPRINGFIEMGTFTAILVGLILIVGTGLQKSYVFGRWNAAIVLVLLLNGVAWLTALPVRFPSDVRRAEPAWAAVRDFFVDCRRIWRVRDARISLIGLSSKRGLVIGMAGAMMATLFNEDLTLRDIAIITSWVAAGVAVGSLLAGVQKHPRRVLGLVPLGGVGFTVGMVYLASGDRPEPWFCALVGMAAGLINVPLAATYQAAAPADARGNAMAVRNLTDYVFATIAGLGLYLLGRFARFDGLMQLWLVAGLSCLATLAAWWIFRRELIEQITEFVFAIMYRFRAAGPGLGTFPLKGPVVVVANHSSYMDPMWLGKVLPRTLIPMMTSVFFDHWFLRWTMIYLVDAIRVEASGFRRDVPELREAVAALDAGKCLVIFPEGRLRRSEELPLKLFGQGVWRILKERPETPVVICWIEGGWGSFFSYWKGLPTKNKRFDIARPIGIAVGAQHVLAAEILADQRLTRQYLMEQCGQMRMYLGLEPIGVQPEAEGTSEPEASAKEEV
jgi:1-acyl-sn-glycerol-3-phosphate acyltransferase